ncbi:MAG: DUF2848 domain-containing protein [Mesorhizobium sp.]|uniref:DUF2848 family protein n=1 Tax=unclassified Mesorhizobium TaxID=325217 RepID=UPI000F758C54|nr:MULTISPECIES: DUF2848 family protein [unclassified Mesorhizobium]RVC66790.1 DUF2848 domain-containing protein [Mesorhizobium sp. M00.F.Ca.ET.038.03.1.1]RVC82753.1 DUF2848 domain-containing protein [Mesorhizobium sp. M2A.F.Ca.ET.046.02.1.1]AZO34770.1 DUF2848 domain-containing protein [Mesorhizobium sp. M2A.F.Ca.ET.046.03.2.1]RWE21672.1 MAG: DUF2848 domain-containing protein [Mesorhizobium sp.]RWF06277.1 MAG: DUF2848 domain-containing protein [Mesorhizobium sp.]
MTVVLSFQTPAGPVSATIRHVLAAGYTGRTRHLVEAHIEELKEIGIPAPPHVPMLFPIIPGLLSQSTETQVLGSDTSPEVEYVVFRQGGRDYVTVGSDQTDSVMEAQNAPMAKNMCLKSIAPDAWPLEEVLDHWDSLELSLVCDGKLMQQGKVEQMMRPAELQEFVSEHDGHEHEGRMIFSGTLEMNGRCPRERAEMTIKLHDPVLERAIVHRYTVEPTFPFF